MPILDTLQRTGDLRWLIVPRLLAGVCLTLGALLNLAGAAPLEPIARAAGFPAPSTLALVIAIAELLAGLALTFGLLTRPAGVLGSLTMLVAIASHFRIPDDRWPQGTSGALGPEPLAPFLLAWLVLGACVLVTIRGGGRWSLDRRQLATRASSRSWGLDTPPPPRTKSPKPSKKPTHIEPTKDGESVW